MRSDKEIRDAAEVDDYLKNYDTTTQEIVQFLRHLFLSTDPRISEHIKWNSPAFYFNGEMAASDAKEYRRDLVVINLHRGKILLVFPTGNSIDDAIGLGGKNYPDGRKIVQILNIEQAQSLAHNLIAAIKFWLSLVKSE